ncbi:MAG: hypothetical protein JW862_06300 [Anaerolineales bacterium]|nr:hypothetical protein [Anaerolineales bacterium]
MRLTFLGTAAANAFPEPFCSCSNCQQARRSGGPSLRRRSAALVDQVLLLDLGPDVLSAANSLGLDFTQVRYCLQTHAHVDHLDASHLLSRSPGYGVAGAPCLHFYASPGSLAELATWLKADLGTDGLYTAEALNQLNLALHPVVCYTPFEVGPYQVVAFPANHDPRVEPCLYAIRDADSSLFYATDTASLPVETWQGLHTLGWQFDLVVLDHTYGPQEVESDHLNARRVSEYAYQLRRDGLLTTQGRVFATHIAHEGNPAHPELVAYGQANGYEIAYDGLQLVF